jgi:DNA-binding winged helix-turn-helix (wHTH) protein/Tol biopolymer transport system component
VADTQHPLRPIRFGAFEVDLRTGELRKAGVKLKFGGQPFQVLAILLERPGDVVTRDELQKRLWPDTFVDVDRNLNTSINKIRDVLGDSAENPRFIETLPRRGYRFIAPVERDTPTVEQPVETPPTIKLRIWKNPAYYGLAIIFGVMVAAALLILWKSVARTPSVPRVVRFIKLTNDGQAKMGPLATDGSRIYFNELLPSGRDLITQVSVKGGEVVPLSVPLEQPEVLDVSKDGTELLVAKQESYLNSLWIQPVAGGSPRRIGTFLARDAKFERDATSVFYIYKHDVYSADRNNASPRKLFTADGYPFGLSLSPDAKILRFTQVNYEFETSTITEARTDGTGLRRLFQGQYGEWTPDGRYFVFQRMVGGSFDLRASPEERSQDGPTREDKSIPFTPGSLELTNPLPSEDGKKIFAVGGTRQAEIVRYDTRSREFVPYLNGISAEGLAFSPDRQWVAYTSYPEYSLWRSKTDGTERLQLTFPPMVAGGPRWSPDGKQIAFHAVVPGAPYNMYIISSAGGTPERILPANQSQVDPGWSPDGNSLIFGSLLIPDQPISIIDLRSRRASLLPGSKGLFSPHWSPDGKYISGTTSDGETLMLFDVSTQKWAHITDTVVGYPIWSHDGKYLYFKYVPPRANAYRIVRIRPGDRKIETVAVLDNVGRLTAGKFGSWFGLAPDDSPLLARDISTQEIYALEMDWP